MSAAAAVVGPGCDGDLSLVDPVPLFAFDPANAWPATCTTQPGAPGHDTGVPPPPGLAISACPNPAPRGTDEITIQFRIDLHGVHLVNLAIVNARGEIVGRLLTGRRVAEGELVSVPWLLDGVPAGDYRAYFKATSLETSGDLRVD